MNEAWNGAALGHPGSSMESCASKNIPEALAHITYQKGGGPKNRNGSRPASATNVPHDQPFSISGLEIPCRPANLQGIFQL